MISTGGQAGFFLGAHSVHIICRQRLSVALAVLPSPGLLRFLQGRLQCFKAGINTQMSNCSAFPSQTAIDLHLMRLMLRLMQDPKDSQNANPGKDCCMFIITRHLLLGNWNSCIVSCCC